MELFSTLGRLNALLRESELSPVTAVIQPVNRRNRVKPHYRVLLCDERGQALRRFNNTLGVFKTEAAAIERIEAAGLRAVRY